MANVFDQMNQQQQVKRGPENDYSQAMGMLGGRSARSPNWENYQGLQSGDASKTAKGIGDAAKGLFGYDQTVDHSGDQTSITPQQNPPSQGQMAPQSAMAMVGSRPTMQPQWSNYGGGGGGGGGGGMDMSSMASMAMAFV